MSFNNGTWNTTGTSPAPAPARPARYRVMGGPPLTVLLRLVFASLVVGALLMWLNIEPFQLWDALGRFAERLWTMGFAAFGQAGRYILAGAAIVVPVWLVMRLLTLRGPR